MTTNNYQQLNLKNKNKNKLSKQLEQEQNHRNGDHTEGYQWGGRKRRMGEKGSGNKKHIMQAQNRQGQNSIGNGEAKEFICTTHGHELWGEKGRWWRVRGCGTW